MGAKIRTLCWQCAKACGKCSWSGGKFVPIDGWEAKPTYIKDQEGVIRSFLITACPEFVSDMPPIAENVEVKEKRKRRK